MFKSAAAVAAITAIVSTGAFAKGVSIPAGQYLGVQQFTALSDPGNYCGSLITIGGFQNTVATIAGLGMPWTQVIASVGATTAASGSTPASAAGIGAVGCELPTLPAATSFVGTVVAGKTTYPYTYSPPAGTTDTTTCAGGLYQLSSSNGGTNAFGQTQTETFTILAPTGAGADYAFELNTTNSMLSFYNATAGKYVPTCAISTSSLYLNSVK